MAGNVSLVFVDEDVEGSDTVLDDEQIVRNPFNTYEFNVIPPY
jgi:hypothetical protein